MKPLLQLLSVFFGKMLRQRQGGEGLSVISIRQWKMEEAESESGGQSCETLKKTS